MGVDGNGRRRRRRRSGSKVEGAGFYACRVHGFRFTGSRIWGFRLHGLDSGTLNANLGGAFKAFAKH